MFRIASAVAVLLLCNPAPADDGSWTGKKVMPAKSKFTFQIDNAKGDRVEVEPRAVLYTVVRDDGGLLRLNTMGQEGWGKKSEWVTIPEATAHYTDLLRADPKDTWARLQRGISWRERGEFDNAVKDFDECIRLDPKSGAAYRFRGSVRAVQGEHKRAIEDYDENIRLEPKSAKAYFARGVSWKELNELDKALADYDEAIRLDPTLAVAFNNRANVHLAREEYDEALKDYTEAFRNDPRHFGAVYNRGRIWQQKREYEKALKDYDESLRIRPDFDYALAQKARLLAGCPDEKFRNGKLAVELATRACELTKWNTGDCLDALAAAYAEEGDFEKAVKYQKQAMEDKEYVKAQGESGREALRLYEQKKPYRQ